MISISGKQTGAKDWKKPCNAGSKTNELRAFRRDAYEFGTADVGGSRSLGRTKNEALSGVEFGPGFSGLLRLIVRQQKQNVL